MIKLGICTAIDNINKVAAMGFDYLEGGLASIAGMTDEDYEKACALVDAAPIKVESCNGMLPGDLKIVGEEVNAQAIHDYLDKAFARAKRLGVKVVVFGSGRSRSVPEGFSTAQAWRQVSNFLRLAERHAQENDITIAIEPLRAVESNIMNFVSEATLMSSLIQMPHIGVLGDTYHMAMGSEPLSAFTMAGDLLKHVHVACAIGRAYPKHGDGEDYEKLFETLRGINYEGRVSIEGRCDDFDTEAVEAFQVLNAARG